MSAYGSINRLGAPKDQLRPTVWRVQPKELESATEDLFLAIFHITLPLASHPEKQGLIECMHKEFAEEVARGRTYPQECVGEEGYTQAAFEGYFFAGDGVFLAMSVGAEVLRKYGITPERIPVIKGEEGQAFEANLDLTAIRAGRTWEESIAGFYYVKPNYPGRSSHICNAGFVTPLVARGRGYARVLARSYLHYGPRLGYKASVFNLVYVNNTASVRLWEKLNFIKAGCIPKAGRLVTEDGEGEEYVDAWVFYKSFEDIKGPNTSSKLSST